jgi:hypothetical protein
MLQFFCSCYWTCYWGFLRIDAGLVAINNAAIFLAAFSVVVDRVSAQILPASHNNN